MHNYCITARCDCVLDDLSALSPAALFLTIVASTIGAVCMLGICASGVSMLEEQVRRECLSTLLLACDQSAAKLLPVGSSWLVRALLLLSGLSSADAYSLAARDVGVYVPCITVRCARALEDLSSWPVGGILGLMACGLVASAALFACRPRSIAWQRVTAIASALLAVAALALPVAVELHPSRDCFAARPGRTDSCWDTKHAQCDFARTSWLFFSTCTRGTGVAMFDYADIVADSADSVVVLCNRFPDPTYAPTLARFQRRFPGKVYEGGASLVEGILRNHSITHVYALVNGDPGSAESKHLLAAQSKYSIILDIHAVFVNNPPFPAPVRNARISYSVPGKAPIVPHMVRLATTSRRGNLRSKLGFQNDTVFCSIGGASSFDIPFVRKLVCQIVTSPPASRPNRPRFLTANHKPFCERGAATVAWNATAIEATRFSLIHLPAFRNEYDKELFMNTCDAFLHARASGETFGLAVAEFSAMNKAVLAYYDPPSKAHLHILGRKALLYKDARSLETHIRAFSRARSSSMSWDVYTQQYNPKAVMRRFCHIFK